MPICPEQDGRTAPRIAKLRNTQKAQKDAERPESAERRRKGLFGEIRTKKSVQIAAAQPVVDSGRLIRYRLATKIIYY